jgi:hypothetical protein
MTADPVAATAAYERWLAGRLRYDGDSVRRRTNFCTAAS